MQKKKKEKNYQLNVFNFTFIKRTLLDIFRPRFLSYVTLMLTSSEKYDQNKFGELLPLQSSTLLNQRC